jgi:nicotinate-nucleotide adenylyltransferase
LKIAIFGGSFDPPHKGHESIINEALKTLDIETLFVVPTYLNPFKDSFVADERTRLLWLEKLFKDKNKIKILDFEVKQKKAVPTIETVLYLLSLYDLEKIYLIVGSDNFSQITKWHRYDELKNLVEFVIATRDVINFPKDLKKLSINVNISSSKLREKMDISFIPKKIENDVKKYYQGK